MWWLTLWVKILTVGNASTGFWNHRQRRKKLMELETSDVVLIVDVKANPEQIGLLGLGLKTEPVILWAKELTRKLVSIFPDDLNSRKIVVPGKGGRIVVEFLRGSGLTIEAFHEVSTTRQITKKRPEVLAAGRPSVFRRDRVVILEDVVSSGETIAQICTGWRTSNPIEVFVWVSSQTGFERLTKLGFVLSCSCLVSGIGKEYPPIRSLSTLVKGLKQSSGKETDSLRVFLKKYVEDESFFLGTLRDIGYNRTEGDEEN